jgi:hypothetical protein
MYLNSIEMIAKALVAGGQHIVSSPLSSAILVGHHHHKVNVVVARIRIHNQLRLSQPLDPLELCPYQILYILRE